MIVFLLCVISFVKSQITSNPTQSCVCTPTPTAGPTRSPTTMSPVPYGGLQGYRFLRAGCRTGHPPFADWNDNTGQCEGMAYELFKLAAARANITYSMTRNPNSTTSSLTKGIFDVSISVTSVSAVRAAVLSFSQPIVDVYFVVVVRGTLTHPTTTILDALFDKSVLYLFALMMVLVLVRAALLIIIESRTPTSAVMSFDSWYKRFLFTIEISLTNALTLSGGNFSSQLSRSLKAVFIIVMYFFSCLFPALLSSVLTNAGVRKPVDVYSDLRGLHIYCGENTDMSAFLGSTRIGAIPIYYDTLAPWAFRILNGTDKVSDGFVTSVDEAQAFLALYPDTHFVTSAPFTITGTTEPRAVAMAQTVPRDIFQDFNVAMSELRESGEVARLLVQFVPQKPAPLDNSLGISPDAATQLQGVTIAVYVMFFVVVSFLFVAHALEHRDDVRESRKSKMLRKEQNGQGPAPFMMVTFRPDDKGGLIPVSCSTVSTWGEPMFTTPDGADSEYLKSLLNKCRKDDGAAG